MFVLDINKFTDSDLANAKEFVSFWSNYYSSTTRIYKTEERISYIKELNLCNDLTCDNVTKLLRWKDPRMLTEANPLNPSNPRVKSVLQKVDDINSFRRSENNETKFRNIVQGIFPKGFIWPVFLLHIARPYEFPIADRNVFTSFSILTNNEIPEDWKGYKNYKDFFFKVAKSAGFITKPPTGNESNIYTIVAALKKVDDALFVFGKFLNIYSSNCVSTKSRTKKKEKYNLVIHN